MNSKEERIRGINDHIFLININETKMSVPLIASSIKSLKLFMVNNTENQNHVGANKGIYSGLEKVLKSKAITFAVKHDALQILLYLIDYEDYADDIIKIDGLYLSLLNLLNSKYSSEQCKLDVILVLKIISFLPEHVLEMGQTPKLIESVIAYLTSANLPKQGRLDAVLTLRGLVTNALNNESISQFIVIYWEIKNLLLEVESNTEERFHALWLLCSLLQVQNYNKVAIETNQLISGLVIALGRAYLKTNTNEIEAISAILYLLSKHPENIDALGETKGLFFSLLTITNAKELDDRVKAYADYAVDGLSYNHINRLAISQIDNIIVNMSTVINLIEVTESTRHASFQAFRDVLNMPENDEALSKLLKSIADMEACRQTHAASAQMDIQDTIAIINLPQNIKTRAQFFFRPISETLDENELILVEEHKNTSKSPQN